MISPGMRLGSGSGSRALSSSSLELDTLRLYSERVVSSAFPSLSFCTCTGQLEVLSVNNNSQLLRLQVPRALSLGHTSPCIPGNLIAIRWMSCSSACSNMKWG